MGKNRRFNRRGPKRHIGRKVIIICEGKRTEYGYFNAIRCSMRLPTLQVLVVHPNATDPYSIVCKAIEYRKMRTREKAWSTEDSAWAVFDGDEHKDNNPDNWNNAIQLARSKKINLAISNPCFELLYLLHYQDQFAKLTRQEAQALLVERHLPAYKKTDITMASAS